MPRKFFKKYLPSHDSIRQNRFINFFGKSLHHHNLWHLHRRSVAGGFAAGLFAGLIPGSNPVQFFFAALFSIIFKVNLPVAALTTLYSNPFTILPLYWTAYLLGGFFIDNGMHSLPPVELNLSEGLLGMGANRYCLAHFFRKTLDRRISIACIVSCHHRLYFSPTDLAILYYLYLA